MEEVPVGTFCGECDLGYPGPFEKISMCGMTDQVKMFPPHSFFQCPEPRHCEDEVAEGTDPPY